MHLTTLTKETYNQVLEQLMAIELPTYEEIAKEVFEHCWNHPNWKGDYDIKDMNDYLKTLTK